MKCDIKAVRLHKMVKTPSKPPGILRESLPVLVSGIESASNYESFLLIATIPCDLLLYGKAWIV